MYPIKIIHGGADGSQISELFLGDATKTVFFILKNNKAGQARRKKKSRIRILSATTEGSGEQ